MRITLMAILVGASVWQAEAVSLDVSSPDSIKEAFAQAAERFGPATILVNNAGITRDGLALRMSSEHWHKVLETNLTGSFLCVQAVLRGMMKQRWGRIINVTSVVALSGNPGQANYVSAKAGLIGLTKSLALEVSSRNITVNAVAPGVIATGMTEVLDEKVRERILSSVPLKRMGTPEEIAKAALFLACDDSSFVTGTEFVVDGGIMAAYVTPE